MVRGQIVVHVHLYLEQFPHHIYVQLKTGKMRAERGKIDFYVK